MTRHPAGVRLWAGLASAALVAAWYGGAIHNFFLFGQDMDMIRLANDRVLGGGWEVWRPRSLWRPLSEYLHHGLWVVTGQDPVPWHLLQMTAHAGAGLVVYAIGRACLSPGAAWLGAGLFLIAPLHGRESVVWLASMHQALAGLAALLVMAMLWRYAQDPRPALGAAILSGTVVGTWVYPYLPHSVALLVCGWSALRSRHRRGSWLGWSLAGFLLFWAACEYPVPAWLGDQVHAVTLPRDARGMMYRLTVNSLGPWSYILFPEGGLPAIAEAWRSAMSLLMLAGLGWGVARGEAGVRYLSSAALLSVAPHNFRPIMDAHNLYVMAAPVMLLAAHVAIRLARVISWPAVACPLAVYAGMMWFDAQASIQRYQLQGEEPRTFLAAVRTARGGAGPDSAVDTVYLVCRDPERVRARGGPGGALQTALRVAGVRANRVIVTDRAPTLSRAGRRTALLLRWPAQSGGA